MTPTKSRSKTTRRGFGRIERRASGRYRAAYNGPDNVLSRAPQTFETKEDAEAWLADRRRELVNNSWNPPNAPVVKTTKPLTLGDYATSWLEHRDLKPRTRVTGRSSRRGSSRRSVNGA